MTDQFSKITYLAIEPNSACNLRCPSCTREQQLARGWRDAKNMTVDELEAILSQFAGCPVDTIKLQGLSEPMLHGGFDLLAQTARRFFPSAFLISSTNLQYDVRKTPFVRALDSIDMQYLSIDGTGDLYEAARLGGRWPKLLRALEDIAELVPAEVRGRKLHINFVLTPANYLELPRLYELKERFGLASVRINLAQEWDAEQMNSREFSDEIVEFLQPHRRDVKGVGGWTYSECYWPFSGVVIDVFGNLRQCVINTSQEPLGNLFQTPAREIFNTSPILNGIRRALKKNCAAESCRTCDYKNLSLTLQRIHGARHAVNLPRTFQAAADA